MKLLGSSLLLAALLAPAPVPAQEAGAKRPEYGILLLTAGSGPDWNDKVIALGAQANKKTPTEVSFGIYVGVAQIRDIQSAVDRLAQRKVKKIVVVPLFIDSDSPDMDQTRYALGLEEDPAQARQNAQEDNPMAGADHGKDIGSEKPVFHSQFPSAEGSDTQVHTKLPLVLADALDGGPVLGDILLSRAKGLSHDPSKETVILVGNGFADEEMNKSRLKALDDLAAAVKEKGKFRAARSATLREDAPQEAKEKAAKALRSLVAEAERNSGTAILVPAVLATGAMEDHLKNQLEGSFYAWDGKAVLPDTRLAKWVLDEGAAAATQPDERKHK